MSEHSDSVAEYTQRQAAVGERAVRAMADSQRAALLAGARNAAAASGVARRRNEFLASMAGQTLASMAGQRTDESREMRDALDDAFGAATEAEADGWAAVEEGFRGAESVTAAAYEPALSALEQMMTEAE